MPPPPYVPFLPSLVLPFSEAVLLNPESVLGIGLPDIPCFTRDPVFQPLSPASWEKTARDKSTVFD